MAIYVFMYSGKLNGPAGESVEKMEKDLKKLEKRHNAFSVSRYVLIFLYFQYR